VSTAPRKPLRKRLTGEERRAAILGSAVEVFADRGYHASSIDDIAREGGISKALIYEHFGSKQELYVELLDEYAGGLFDRLDAAIATAGPSASARLSVGVDAFYGFVEEHRVAWRMLFREATDPEVAVLLDRVVAQVTGLVAALIAEDPGSVSAGDEEVPRDQSIQMLAQALVGAVQALANWWADHPAVRREKIVEQTMDFVWLGLDRLSQGESWSVAAP
jgi:AcrR family transcriptional regulator